MQPIPVITFLSCCYCFAQIGKIGYFYAGSRKAHGPACRCGPRKFLQTKALKTVAGGRRKNKKAPGGTGPQGAFMQENNRTQRGKKSRVYQE